MHRYQTFLKEDNNFRKHVTWFTSTSVETLSTVALFEYSGTFPNPQNKVNFIRTHPKTMNVIKEELKTKPPKQIYLDMNRNDSINAPKDTKQIKNAKYRNKQKEKPMYSKNVADELLQVLAMMNDHPVVQQVIHRKDQVSAIIYYAQDQKTDLKHFLSLKTDLPIGVDRTFNLGTFFAATLVYKNQRVARKEIKDHPIFAGPMLLRKDVSYQAYRAFFSHLCAELEHKQLRDKTSRKHRIW